MKRIGTITNYYPFLTEDTKNVLESVMEEASNYYDFIIRLGTKICDEEVSLELAYMAAVHLLHSREVSLQERVREKYKDHPEIILWTFPVRSGADIPRYHDEFQEVLKRATDANPPDWVLIELKRVSSIFFRTSSEFSEGSKEFRMLLDRNPELRFFEAHYHDMRADMYDKEGDHVNAILEAEKSIEAAKKADDDFYTMGYTGFLGILLRNSNPKASMDYTEEYNRRCESLGIPWTLNIARNRMGVIHLIMGEYDMAIECQLAALEVYYHDKSFPDVLSSLISSIYCDLGNGLEALNWSDKAFAFTDGTNTAFMYYTKTWALILLGVLEDAEHSLNLLHKLTLTSAIEYETALYLHMRGLYELASGIPEDAIHTLEETLAIIEPLNIQGAINRILVTLVQAEIQLSDESQSRDSSGPWMVRLESHARKKGYSGIQMQAALLRAEFFVKQGRIDEAKKVLHDALTILDSPTVKSLRGKIEKMIEEISTT